MRRERLLLRAMAIAACAALGACAPGSFGRGDGGRASPPAIDRTTAAATLLAGYLDMLHRLVQSAPAEQAELMAATRHEFEVAPTPSNQLRYSLALAAPGHTGTDLPHAQRLLRELLAAPEMLLPAERSLAFLELQTVDQQLNLSAENRRLQNEAGRSDRDRIATLTKRLQAEIEENARLRKELDDAHAKLDAIANIERSINERTPNTEGRSP